ncbi:MAG TPA: sigma-70 family RNA polymerase sigma factor, partial [Actinomycetota bacterium]|nr:sigma-70 family RNA polymerase sigma factor [Actinomycetota bacterium]
MSIASRILYLEPLADLRSDEWLVRAAKSGNSEAAATLFRRYHGRVLAFISHMTGGRSNSEDITQETFIRALRGLDGFDGRRFEAWLLRIARNLVIDEARRDPSQPTPVPPEELAAIEPKQGRSGGVWDLYSANLATTAVHEALAKLPIRQRTVIVLRDIEGRSRDEIAEILGTNPHAI